MSETTHFNGIESRAVHEAAVRLRCGWSEAHNEHSAHGLQLPKRRQCL